MRERPVYDLVIAKNGPKLKKAASTVAADIVAKHPEAGALPGADGMFTMGRGNSVDMYGVSLRDTHDDLVRTADGRLVVDRSASSRPLLGCTRK